MDAPPMDAPPMDAPWLDGPAAALVPPVAPESALEVQGDVLLVRTAGSQRRVQIGCAGDLAVQAGEHVYVRCPPQQVARVSLSESAPGSVVFEVLGDVADLRAVDGVPWLIGADGRARRLARSIAPGFSVDAPALGGRPSDGAPDLRLDQILGRVRALDEAGRPDGALDVLTTEVALRRCPPLLWDADTFAAVRHGIHDLENPTAAGNGWFFAGLPTLILGAVGGLLGSVVVGVIGVAEYAAFVVPAAISLVVVGALMMMTGKNVFNSTARTFEDRRQDVYRRAVRPRGVRATELTPAFGVHDCGAD